MSEKINWALNIQVVGGPKIFASKIEEVDAYDKIDVSIAAGKTAEKIQIQPGDKGQLQFLLIMSSHYSDDLTYSVNAVQDTETKRIKLDAPQLFIGDGAIGLFGDAPKTLFFYNKLTSDLSIQILVGRKA